MHYNLFLRNIKRYYERTSCIYFSFDVLFLRIVLLKILNCLNQNWIYTSIQQDIIKVFCKWKAKRFEIVTRYQILPEPIQPGLHGFLRQGFQSLHRQCGQKHYKTNEKTREIKIFHIKMISMYLMFFSEFQNITFRHHQYLRHCSKLLPQLLLLYSIPLFIYFLDISILRNFFPTLIKINVLISRNFPDRRAQLSSVYYGPDYW